MKLIVKSALFIGLVAVVSACYDDPGTDILPWDQPYLELDRAGQGTPTVAAIYQRLNDGTTYDLNVQVNIMGRPRDVATTVNFTIDPASLAVPGVHYNKITSGNSITIPAGASSANIEFEVLADNMNGGEVWPLIISVASPDVPSSQYVKATWNLQVTCPFNRAFFIGNYNTLEPGYGTYTNVTTPHATETNAIMIDNFWDVGASVKYVFSTTSNAVSVATTNFTANIGSGPETLTVSANGAGTYNACAGSFVVPYRVTRVSSGATVETNTHTFTKQ